MDFIQHAENYGLRIRSLIADGRWHRVPTDDKPHKRNGAYLFDGDKGVVRNWATMEGYARWPERGEKPAPVNAAFLREARERHQKEEVERHEKAAARALALIQCGLMKKHPYLAAKGFADHLGLVCGEDLVIPMRHYNTMAIMSAQKISPTGGKLFLPGGATKGAVFVLGRKKWSAPDAMQRWLVEGYATGLSVNAVLQSITGREPFEVWVCFSAGNLQYVADRIGGRRYVVADNDASGTGQNVARDTGLPWGMSEVVGEDFNDLHRRVGVWKAAKLLHGIMEGVDRVKLGQ